MKMRRPSKIEMLMEVAEVIAKRSTCARRQVGCVITNKLGWILATGYNGQARGTPHCIDTPCPGASYAPGEGLALCEASHAEQAALIQLREPLEARILVCTTMPCMHCIKMISMTSVQIIVYRHDYPDGNLSQQYWDISGRHMPGLRYCFNIMDPLQLDCANDFMTGMTTL